MGGKPCILGMCFTVYDLASYLASGMTEAEIFATSLSWRKTTSWPSMSSSPAFRKGFQSLKLFVDENLPATIPSLAFPFPVSNTTVTDRIWS